MKRRTDILTHLLLLLLVLVACTADDAIKENLSHQDEYVTVRMHIPGMKAVATRAAETDNITSIVALVFRNDQLQSVTEYTTANSTLHPISPISGTITIDKPNDKDVIHFLANLPADYSNEKKYIAYLNEQIGKSQTEVLCNLSSRDYDKLSYWGMATRNENNAVMDVMLYRNKAMIEIKPGENCTFRQDELFIAGLDNPNNVGLLVPYSANGGFNFDLGSNDYLTLPAEPDPLDKTDELTNYGAGYDNAYYVFEHENPDDAANGLYVICKIGNDYYKVALHDEKGQPYPIIRNHKYTILVNDLDAGCETYSEALSAEPIKPTVIETKDVTFTYTDNAMLNLNDNDTYTVTMNVPNGGILTALNIAAEGFTVTSSGGSLSGPTNNEYSYTGGTTQFTFTPTSAGNRTISFNGGAGVDITVPEKNISVTVNAAIAATANPSTIYYDGNDKNVTVNVTIPKGVSGLNISAPDFNYGDDTDGSYTYNRGDATTETTVQLVFTLKDGVTEDASITFSDASANANVEGLEVNINVEQTPIISFSKTGTQTITLNGSPLSVEMDTYGKSLSEFVITVTPATGLNVTQDGNQLTLNNDGVYSTNVGVSGTPTFTFAPTAVGTYTITFSGSGIDVNMPEIDGRKIILTVNAAATGGDGNIVWQWTGDTVNVSGYNTSSSIIPSSDINEQFIVNNIFGIKVEPTAGANDPCVVVKVFNRYGTGKDLSSTAHNNGNKDRINVSGSEIYEFLITQELVDLLHEQEDANNKGKIGFWGNGVIITDIYIKQGTANQ